MSLESTQVASSAVASPRIERELATFATGSVVQLVRGEPTRVDAVVTELHPASITITTRDEVLARVTGI